MNHDCFSQLWDSNLGLLACQANTLYQPSYSPTLKYFHLGSWKDGSAVKSTLLQKMRV